MNRNIAKPFAVTLSLLDVASDKTHKYKCFHGEDVQLTVKVVGENNKPIDLSNTSVKIYFTLDKNVNEPVYRQDAGIMVDDLGVITVMLEKSYIRIGNNVLKIVLYDEDQTVFLQPLIISCIDPLIGEVADLEIPDDINVRDEIYDIRRIIGDLQDFDVLGREIIDIFDSQLENNTNAIKQITNPSFNSSTLATFIIDDGDETFVTNGYEDAFNSRGLKATLGIISKAVIDNQSGKMKLSKLIELNKNGWDIVSHSHTHSTMYSDVNATEQTIYDDMKLSYDWIKENGFNSDVIVYPYGNFADKNKYTSLAKQIYKYGVNASGAYNNSPIDTMYIQRCNLSQSLEKIKSDIDGAFKNNGWIVFLIHTYASANVTIEKLNDVFDYLASKDIKVLTFKEAIKQKGNALSIGNIDDGLFVGGDGKTNLHNYCTLGMTDRYPTDLINEYPLGIEIKTISIAIGYNYPLGKPGLLITYRPVNDYYAFQQYKIKNTTIVYERYWDIDDTWSEWVEVDPRYVSYGRIVRDISTPLSDFPDGIEFKTIGIEAAPPFPEGMPGLLETNKNCINKFYSYQVYHIKDSAITYKRWWSLNPDDSESWGQFVKII